VAAAPALAYFITFSTYGTWLHGDERGSMQRGLTGPDAPPLDPNPRREGWEASQRLDPPVTLGGAEWQVVDAAIRETAAIREWHVYALNVRTNHVHIVVSAEIPPEPLMGSLKAWCTKRLRGAGRRSLTGALPVDGANEAPTPPRPPAPCASRWQARPWARPPSAGRDPCRAPPGVPSQRSTCACLRRRSAAPAGRSRRG
jgi:hypothetical protein